VDVEGCVGLVAFFFFKAEDGIGDWSVTGVQTCALPILGLVVAAARAHGPTPRAGRARAAATTRPSGNAATSCATSRPGGPNGGRTGERRGGEGGERRWAGERRNKKEEEKGRGARTIERG